MRYPIDGNQGHELAYEVRGDGRPILLLHGLTGDRRVMLAACEPVLAEVPGWRRIYVDLPGHGEARGDRTRTSADTLVEALAAFLRDIAGAGAEHPLVVGYSYGGYLAQGLLRELPQIGGMCLVCPVVEADFGKRRLPEKRVSVREDDLPWGDDPRVRPAFEEVSTHWTRAQLELFLREIHPANVAADPAVVGAIRYRYSMARQYALAMTGYDRPVAIVCGRDDHWTGWQDAARLARHFVRGSFALVPDAGHLLPLEQPADFHAALRRWLARCAIVESPS